MTQPTTEEKKKAKQEAAQWAKTLLLDEKALIVDVETTGLLTKDPKTEIVSFSFIDMQGRLVFSGLVNPQRPIPIEAQKIHGINDKAVKESFPFLVIGKLIAETMFDRKIVAYNAGFDIHLLVTLMQRYNIKVPTFEADCAMEKYSEWVGDWSAQKKDWKWQKLPKLAYGKAHDSLVDCQSTLMLLKKMAGDTSDDPSLEDLSLNF